MAVSPSPSKDPNIVCISESLADNLDADSGPAGSGFESPAQLEELKHLSPESTLGSSSSNASATAPSSSSNPGVSSPHKPSNTSNAAALPNFPHNTNPRRLRRRPHARATVPIFDIKSDKDDYLEWRVCEIADHSAELTTLPLHMLPREVDENMRVYLAPRGVGFHSRTLTENRWDGVVKYHPWAITGRQMHPRVMGFQVLGVFYRFPVVVV